MRAAVYRGIADIAVEDVAAPTAVADEIVLAVDFCGICGSDLHSYSHGALVEPGQIMGHEFSGRVLEVGAEVSGIEVGERVTAMPITACEECARCAEGRFNLCLPAWRSAVAYGRPGAFAERVAIPNAELGRNVFKLGDVPARDGATVEPLAVAVHAVKVAGEVAGRTALVIGLGMIGQQVCQVLLAGGAGRVIGLDLAPARLEIARGFGVEALDGSPGMKDALKSVLAPGEEIDLVFECSGVAPLLAGSLRAVRAGGTVAVLALYPGGVEIDPLRLVQKEIDLRGAFGFLPEDFADALELLREGRAVAEPLIDKTVPLAGIAAAFESQIGGTGAPKVLVDPNR